MLFSEQYSIGGLDLYVEGKHTMKRMLEIYGFNRFVVKERSVYPLTVCLDVPLTLPECRWLHSFGIMEDTAECRFGVDGRGVYWFEFGDEGVLRYDPRQPELVLASSFAEHELVRFVMWVAYSLLALPKGVVPVHASVVVCEGRAVLCLGESGTGKSTHTQLWCREFKHCNIINDDSPVVCIEGDQVVVYGSPWSGKSPFYHTGHYPAAGFLRIEQRPENTIMRLKPLEAFGALQPSCPPALAHDEHMLDLIADFIGHIILRTPVYRLGCRPDAGAARLSHDTIFPEPCR